MPTASDEPVSELRDRHIGRADLRVGQTIAGDPAPVPPELPFLGSNDDFGPICAIHMIVMRNRMRRLRGRYDIIHISNS